jgi:hypothetical protein
MIAAMCAGQLAIVIKACNPYHSRQYVSFFRLKLRFKRSRHDTTAIATRTVSTPSISLHLGIAAESRLSAKPEPQVGCDALLLSK